MTDTIRTSDSHPIRIDHVQLPNGGGKIGMSFCPGKKQLDGWTGQWDRDLEKDLTAISDWGAAMVVTLIEDHEFAELQVRSLPDRVGAMGMVWRHLPIPDRQEPGAAFDAFWPSFGHEIMALLREGKHVFIHCKGGLGRTGTIAGCLLIEAGTPPEEAITAVRVARQHTIETNQQEMYVRNYQAMF